MIEIEKTHFKYNTSIISEVLVKGNSVSLRLSASTDNLIKGKVEESHFALELKVLFLGKKGKWIFLTFPLAEIPSTCR